jgi:MinD-like ATPase involved in chromosome partitioning or flagellar assembly
MVSLEIEILNPEARKLLDNLANLKLIRISQTRNLKNEFLQLLNKLRNNSEEALTLDEIQKEVEAVRNSRYADK